jgi:hypothetical protein
MNRVSVDQCSCIGQRTQRVVGPDKNPRETAVPHTRPNAKPMVRRLCPMHEKRRPAFQWWRGFTTIGHLPASNPTLLLVTGLPYAAALALHYSNPPPPGWSPEKLPAHVDL